MQELASPPLRRNQVSVGGYAAAHFGKSLWWNGSELFLGFYLTEYLALDAFAAAGAIAFGLSVGAAMDLAVARRCQWFASVASAGRVQAWGALGSLAALMLLVAAATVDEGFRLAAVIVANLVFRLAYVFYDLPQNCLLSLIEWSRDSQRKAAAARTAASAAALVTVSTMVSFHDDIGAYGPVVATFVAGSAAAAVGSALWLWRATRGRPGVRRFKRAALGGKAGPALALMAIVCLTAPAFSKLAPYLTTYGFADTAFPMLVSIGACTALSQPLWLALLRRRGEARSAGIAGILLVLAGIASATGALGLAAIMVGLASGGLGTVIWASLAAAVNDDDPVATAPAFALLTATAKISLAVAALVIGAILGTTEYRADGARLLPFMTALVLSGGIGVIAVSYRRIFSSGTRAGSA